MRVREPGSLINTYSLSRFEAAKQKLIINNGNIQQQKTPYTIKNLRPINVDP